MDIIPIANRARFYLVRQDGSEAVVLADETGAAPDAERLGGKLYDERTLRRRVSTAKHRADEVRATANHLSMGPTWTSGWEVDEVALAAAMSRLDLAEQRLELWSARLEAVCRCAGPREVVPA